jgi:hypothetical protein
MADKPKSRAPKQPGKILDLFAGAGGWEEGLGMLGMSEQAIQPSRNGVRS